MEIIVNDNLPSLESGVWSVELMVATLRICNVACCMDEFVCLFYFLIDDK